jgi:F-type H+-transporting ATPase subunit delta
MAKKSGNKPLAAIYAHALYDAAVEANALEQVSTEIKVLRDMLAKSPEVERFLVSPTISFDQKRNSIESAFASFSTVTKNFLLVVVDRNRAGNISAIVAGFIEYSHHKEGIAEVQVQTARELQSSERTKLTSLLQGKLNKKITLNEKVRPELLGGMVLIHEDKMWDSSIASGIKQMTERMEALKLTTIKWAD